MRNSNRLHTHHPPLVKNRHRRTMDVHRVFREFADGTSMHGVPRIINARSMCARIFWSIICLCAFGMFIWQTAILLERYYSYPKKVNMEIVQKPVEFPWVSMCNTDHLDLLYVDRLNSFFHDSNVTEINDEQFLYWQSQYEEFWDSSNMFFMPYLMNFPRDKGREDMLAVYSRLGLTANLGVELASMGGIKLEDFIISCRFSGEECNVTKSFIKYFDPEYFNCFTFNPRAMQTGNTSNRLNGAEYGLTVILFMGSAGTFTTGESEVEYIIPGMEESNPAMARGRGARIFVHPPNTLPTPASFGYDAPPGFSITLGVKARENVRIGEPHGNCTPSNPNANYKYSLETCQSNCLQQTIVNTCGCYDNKISIPEGKLRVPYCFHLPNMPMECMFTGEPLSDDCMKIMTSWSERMKCRKEVYENITKHGDDISDGCMCNPPCNDIEYDASYSMSTVPDNEHLFMSLLTGFLDNMPNAKKELLKKKHGENFNEELTGFITRVNIHIADSNVIKTTEAPDYEAIRLISDIGGQLGLWIGISVMTLFEVLQLIVDICRFLTASSRKPRENRRFDQVQPRCRQTPDLPCEIDKLTTV